MARPRATKYSEEFDEQAYKLCLLRATDKEIADFFKISTRTLLNWKRRHPSFRDSIKKGRLIIDADVAASMVMKAQGYYKAEDKIFNNNGAPYCVRVMRYYPPDTMAGIYWLNNRQPELFRQNRNDDNRESAEEIANALVEVAKSLRP